MCVPACKGFHANNYSFRLCPITVIPLCAPAVFPLKPAVLTAAAAAAEEEEFFPQTMTFTVVGFLRRRFLKFPSCQVGNFLSTQPHTVCTQSNHRYNAIIRANAYKHEKWHFFQLYFCGRERDKGKRLCTRGRRMK